MNILLKEDKVGTMRTSANNTLAHRKWGRQEVVPNFFLVVTKKSEVTMKSSIRYRIAEPQREFARTYPKN